ncbi:hypothetical protein ABMA28_015772 [Loxostege sticticalis]|uniref:Uncharacterized protein n=1 Tax=Loxostege sticticalis TaxID=481309 RepID=A0ABD0TDC1_LOXSC
MNDSCSKFKSHYCPLKSLNPSSPLSTGRWTGRRSLAAPAPRPRWKRSARAATPLAWSQGSRRRGRRLLHHHHRRHHQLPTRAANH